jgi:hypothetical protein
MFIFSSIPMHVSRRRLFYRTLKVNSYGLTLAGAFPRSGSPRGFSAEPLIKA